MPSKNNLDGSGPFEADSSQVLKFQFFLCWNMVFGWKTRNIKWYYWWFKNPANSPVDMVNIPFFTTGFMHPNGGLPSPDSPWCQVERPCELGFSLGFRWEPRQPPPFQHDLTHVICHFFLPVMFSSTGISVYLFLKIDMFIYYYFFLYVNIFNDLYIYTLSQWKFPMHLLKLTKIPEDPSDIDMMQDGATSIQLHTYVQDRLVSSFRSIGCAARSKGDRPQMREDITNGSFREVVFRRMCCKKYSSGKHLSLKNMAKHA